MVDISDYQPRFNNQLKRYRDDSEANKKKKEK